MFELASITSGFFVLSCSALFALQLELLDGCIVWMLNFLSVYWPFTTLCSIFIMSNNPISGIPSSLGPSPATTKNLHLAIYLYVLTLLYIHLIAKYLMDCMFLLLLNFLWHAGALIFDLGNKVLNRLNGLKLALLWYLSCMPCIPFFY